MILVIDNYDSFTYNLVQYLGELGEDVVVRRNDEITLDEIEANLPSRILISPGPGTPGRRRNIFVTDQRTSPDAFRSSAFAWAIRRSARLLADEWCAPTRSCTARRRKLLMTASRSFVVSTPVSKPAVIIR